MKQRPWHLRMMPFALLFSLLFALSCVSGGRKPSSRAAASACSTRPEGPNADPDAPPALSRDRLDAFMAHNLDSTVEVRAWKTDGDGTRTVQSGSGVVIGKNGEVLTANHVIENMEYVAVDARRPTLDLYSFRSVDIDVPMRLVRASKKKDVALLIPEKPFVHLKPLQVACGRKPAAREWVWHFGKTSGWALGRITNPAVGVIHVDGHIDAIEAAIECRAGDSGAPLVNTSGQLIGIIVGGSKDSLAYSVPIDTALTALDFAPP